MTTSYSDLLKHPKWQKKRLEILERADFTCEECGNREQTLHVHHGYYEKGLKPWEYSNESLHCLCEKCHEFAQDYGKHLKRLIGKLDGKQLNRLGGYIGAMVIAAQLKEQGEGRLFTNPVGGVVRGLSDYFRIPVLFTKEAFRESDKGFYVEASDLEKIQIDTISLIRRTVVPTDEE